MLRGWANFYRHAWGAKKVFTFLDHYAWWTIARWLRKKHRISLKRLVPRYSKRRPGGRGVRWSDGGVTLFEAASVRVRCRDMEFGRTRRLRGPEPPAPNDCPS